MSDQTQTPADDEEGTMKRSVQMNFFAKRKDHTRLGMLRAAYDDPELGGSKGPLFVNTLPVDPKNPEGAKVGESNIRAVTKGVTLGSIVGVIYSVNARIGRLPDGSEKESLVALGDFEAINYDSGEVIQSATAYLPGYFIATIQAMMEAAKARGEGGNGFEFAVEIVLTATGKPIPTAYEVRPLLRRRAESPLNRVKLALQAAGRLRGLPAPVALTAEPLEGEILAIADQSSDAVDIEPDGTEDDASAPETGAETGGDSGGTDAPETAPEPATAGADAAPARRRS